MFKTKTVKKYTFRVAMFSMGGLNQISEFVDGSPNFLEKKVIQDFLRKIKLGDLFQNQLWYLTHPDQQYTATVTEYFNIPVYIHIMPVMPD